MYDNEHHFQYILVYILKNQLVGLMAWFLTKIEVASK